MWHNNSCVETAQILVTQSAVFLLISSTWVFTRPWLCCVSLPPKLLVFQGLGCMYFWNDLLFCKHLKFNVKLDRLSDPCCKSSPGLLTAEGLKKKRHSVLPPPFPANFTKLVHRIQTNETLKRTLIWCDTEQHANFQGKPFC